MSENPPPPAGDASVAPTTDEAAGPVGAGLAPPASTVSPAATIPPTPSSAPPASEDATGAASDAPTMPGAPGPEAPPVGATGIAALVDRALAAASETRHLTLQA